MDLDLDHLGKELFGGQRTKVLLAKLLLENPMIPDEPTNHSDVEAKEELKKAIQAFKGTLILVSYDSYFYEDIVNCILNIKEYSTKVI